MGSKEYKILGEVGKGSQGRVYKVLCLKSNKLMAVKEIPKERYSREGFIWSSLDHAHIIKVKAVVERERFTYMICEYAGGGELFHLIQCGPLTKSRALEYFYQLCSALAHCHANDIAHRDVKLENVLVFDEKVVKLGDFGFATNEAICRDFIGSVDYTAPEILRRQVYCPYTADCWSMGVILFAMVTGYLPFSRASDDFELTRSPSTKIRKRIMESSYWIPPNIDGIVRKLIRGLLQENVDKRFTMMQCQELVSEYIHKAIILTGTIKDQ